MEVSTAKCPSFSCQIRVTNTEWIRKLCWCCEIFFWNVATSDLWRNLEQVSFRDTSPLLSPPESPFGWCACKHNHFYFNNFAGHIYKKYEARSEMKVCFQDLVWSPSLAHLDLKLAASRTFDTHSPQHTVLIKFRLASFFEDKKSSQNIEKVLEKKNTHTIARQCHFQKSTFCMENLVKKQTIENHTIWQPRNWDQTGLVCQIQSS